MKYDLVSQTRRAILPDGRASRAVSVLDYHFAGSHETAAECAADTATRVGRELAGRVHRTVLRGIDISADVETNGDGHGRLLSRGEA